MPLDAYHLYCLTRELDELLAGGRIDKITMPAANDVLLHVRAGGRNHRLMISADPAKPRLWLTDLDYINPPAPPSFCMHLRKYLAGGRILSCASSPTERVVVFSVLAHSELGDERQLKLIVEIMGRYSNILLVNESGTISDCLKHTPYGAETERPVLPGLSYKPVGQTDKFDYTDSGRLRELIARYPGGELAAHLLTELTGFASYSLRTILKNVSVSVPPTTEQTDAVVRAIEDAYARLETGDYTPKIVEKDGRATEFTLLETEGRAVPALLDAEKAYYGDLDAQSLWKSAVSAPLQATNAAIKKLTKRIAGLNDKIQEADGADRYRIYGEILTANLYRVPPRAAELRAENWYDGSEITIPLDNKQTPTQNANAYFKRYNKLKRAAAIARDLKREAEEEQNYLESVRVSLSTCATIDDVEGVKEELAARGYLKRPRTKGKRPPVKNKPLVLTVSGYEILVGKNNLQNEEITFKIAKSCDVWAHVLRAHGSHVLIKNETGKEVPESVILRACELAAYYSETRDAAKAEVDVCLKKYVSRNAIKGPGNVTYTHQKTYVVVPKE